MEFSIIHKDSHLDRVNRTGIEFVLPCFGYRHRCRISTNGVRVRIRNRILILFGSGVIPVKRSVGVGTQRVSSITIVDNIFLNLRIQLLVRDVSILQLCNNIVSILAGIAVKGDSIFHTVIKHTNRGEIPLDRAVYELCRRSISPLHTILVVLEGRGVDLKQFYNNTGRGLHLIGGTVLDLNGSNTRLLDLSENSGKSILKVRRVRSGEVVARRRANIRNQALHTVNVAVGTDGIKMVGTNSRCKRPRIINSVVIATCNCRSSCDAPNRLRIAAITIDTIGIVVIVVHGIIVAACITECRVAVGDKNYIGRILVTVVYPCSVLKRVFPVGTAICIQPVDGC